MHVDSADWHRPASCRAPVAAVDMMVAAVAVVASVVLPISDIPVTASRSLHHYASPAARGTLLTWSQHEPERTDHR